VCAVSIHMASRVCITNAISLCTRLVCSVCLLYAGMVSRWPASASMRVLTPGQATTSIPRNWHDFLHSDENKMQLFGFLAGQMYLMPVADGKLLISTSDINVRCTQPHYDKSRLEPCAHKEADTRLLLHASDIVHAGYSKLLIRTVDTDVVVLAIAFFSENWL